MSYTKRGKHSYYLACLAAARKCPDYVLSGEATISPIEWLQENVRAALPSNFTHQDVRDCRAKALRVARAERRFKKVQP